MNHERVVEDIVTKFLLNTCRLPPNFSEPAVHAVRCCAVIATKHPDDDEDADLISLTTGSAAEFYIEPMIPHIGDIDVMCHSSTELAIPAGHPPPTQLPDEFHNYVKVFEIVDSHLPGYVYLELRLLTECVDNGDYHVVEYERQSRYLMRSNNENIHGPAVLNVMAGSLLCDNVRCVHSLVWPPQAADWPTRHRNYGWPDSATVDHVVNNGCDVVRVAHRLCRQDEWMSEYQWRLSFSRAEVVLINSWIPVQQIVYHVLRVFLKTERLIGEGSVGTLSNYHIKSLMLWACELKPKIWWTDDFSLVRVCIVLLHDLAAWLIEERCPHYFINNCNLIDSSFDLEIIRNQLISISRSWLTSWFVNNYIRRCSQLCPHSVSRLYDDVSTITKLQNAVSAIVDFRLSNTVRDMFMVFNLAGGYITSAVSVHSLTVRSLDCFFTALTKISASLPVHFLSAVFLHVAHRTHRSGLNDELLDVLAVLVGQRIGPRRYSSQRSSELLLSKAANLMKAVDDRPKLRSTVDLIAIELSKEYLYRALNCGDSDSDSIYCLAKVYLAVLYYTTGQYQTAIDHCTSVMKSQDHSQCSSRVVQREILPKTDDDIDVVLGLAVFYQHVRTAALNQQQQTQHVTVFTTELFAHYLHIKCLSVTKCQQLSDTTNSQSSTYEVQSCVKYITEMQQPFIGDVLLYKLVDCFSAHTCVCKQQSGRRQCPSKYPSELNTSDLVELLQKAAVEHLTACRRITVRELGSVNTIVTTDFEALYAYKRGTYQHCLQLCTQNVRVLLYASFMLTIETFPEFIELLDDDIVSLTALTLILHPVCRSYSDNVGITQLTLSLYLMTQCQLKLSHSVMSLSRTLDYISVAQRRIPASSTLDQLTLKLTERKLMIYLTSMLPC